MSIKEPDEPGKPNVVVDPPEEPEDEEKTKKTTKDKKKTKKETEALTEVAIEVGEGEWGVGQERRQRLADAGYNPQEVEAEVVRLRNQ
jgi:CW_7 repeat